MRVNRYLTILSTSLALSAALAFNAAAQNSAGFSRDYEIDVPDYTEHPLAGGDAVIDFTIREDTGRTTVISREITLPSRHFTHPLARLLIEQRPQLAFSPEESRRISNEVDIFITQYSDLIRLPSQYIALVNVRDGLASAQNEQDYNRAISLMWQVALDIERTIETDSERELREAQQALEEALENASNQGAIADALERYNEARREALREQLEEEARRRAEAAQEGMEGNPQDGAQGQEGEEGGERQPPPEPLSPEEQQELEDLMDYYEEELERLREMAAEDAANQALQQQQQQQSGESQQAQSGSQSMAQMMQNLEQQLQQMEEMQELVRALRQLIEDQTQLKADTEAEIESPAPPAINPDIFDHYFQLLMENLRDQRLFEGLENSEEGDRNAETLSELIEDLETREAGQNAIQENGDTMTQEQAEALITRMFEMRDILGEMRRADDQRVQQLDLGVISGFVTQLEEWYGHIEREGNASTVDLQDWRERLDGLNEILEPFLESGDPIPVRRFLSRDFITEIQRLVREFENESPQIMSDHNVTLPQELNRFYPELNGILARNRMQLNKQTRLETDAATLQRALETELRQHINALRDRQMTLRTEAERLEREFADAGGDPQALDTAEKEMNQARGDLSGNRLPDSLIDMQEALDALSQAEEQAQQMMQQMSQMQSGSSQGMRGEGETLEGESDPFANDGTGGRISPSPRSGGVSPDLNDNDARDLRDIIREQLRDRTLSPERRQQLERLLQGAPAAPSP